MLREQSFLVNDLSINYAEGPKNGSALVLLHGGGDRWQQFLPVLPALVSRWHVYALDMRGHGGSSRARHTGDAVECEGCRCWNPSLDPTCYLPAPYVSDVVAFLTDRVIDPPVLFGNSFGGWVALMAAARLPERVRALILGDPPLNIETYLEFEGSESRVHMWSQLRELAASNLTLRQFVDALRDMPVAIGDDGAITRYGDLPGVDNTQLLGWAKTLSRVDPYAAFYHAEGRLRDYVAGVDLDSALRSVSRPTLLLQADPEYGGRISDADADHAMGLLAQGFHAKLQGVGHDLGLSSWNVRPLLRALTAFLEAL